MPFLKGVIPRPQWCYGKTEGWIGGTAEAGRNPEV